MKQEILEALASLSCPQGIRLCDSKEAEDVMAKIRGRFVVGNPRAWWLAFNGTPEVYDYPDASSLAHLDEHLPSGDSRCWLIIDEGADGYCFDIPLNAVKAFLQLLPFVEYYVVAKGLDWLVCENDHNQILTLTFDNCQ